MKKLFDAISVVRTSNAFRHFDGDSTWDIYRNERAPIKCHGGLLITINYSVYIDGTKVWTDDDRYEPEICTPNFEEFLEKFLNEIVPKVELDAEKKLEKIALERLKEEQLEKAMAEATAKTIQAKLEGRWNG